MQVIQNGKNTIIRAEKGYYLVRKDGKPINNKENYKTNFLIIPNEEIEKYDEKNLYEVEEDK